jgi:hypothetical protein
MAAPSNINVEMDKPPPYSPGYNVNQYQQGGYPPPNQNYNPGYPPPNQGYNPGYPPVSGPPPVIHQQPPQAQVIVVQQGRLPGNCPVCRTGNMYESFTCCGICCAIFFFPLGLICCLLMRETRCSHCGATR